MRILHYIPSIGKSGGGVSAYLQLLSHDLGQLVDLHIVTHHTVDEMQLSHCSIYFIESSIRYPIKMKRCDNVHGLCFGQKQKAILLLYHLMVCWNLGLSERIIGQRSYLLYYSIKNEVLR